MHGQKSEWQWRRVADFIVKGVDSGSLKARDISTMFTGAVRGSVVIVQTASNSCAVVMEFDSAATILSTNRES